LKDYQLKLDQVREFKRKTRLSQTVVCFKVFSGSTPEDLCKKLFGAYSNSLPFDFFNVQTRIDYDYSGHRVHSEECLLFYVFTGCVPPKIEIPNILYCYRKAIDPQFKDMMYKELIRFHGSFIKKLSFEESMRKIKVLKDFSYVKEAKISL
jgi:hypothetical protein